MSNMHRNSNVNGNPQPAYAMAGQCQQAAFQAPCPFISMGEKNRSTAVALAILLGAIGAHKFYLGKTIPAIIMLLACVLGAFIIVGPIVTWAISLNEAKKYMRMSEADFYYHYVVGERQWF